MYCMYFSFYNLIVAAGNQPKKKRIFCSVKRSVTLRRSMKRKILVITLFVLLSKKQLKGRKTFAYPFNTTTSFKLAN